MNKAKSSMPTVVFVCTANLCRSPMAEVLFQKWLRQQGMQESWNVLSCGTWAHTGSRLPSPIVQALSAMGIDVSGHKAKSITLDMVRSADLILCMTRSHKEALQIEFTSFSSRIKLLSEIMNETYDVPDVTAVSRDQCLLLAREMTKVMEQASARIFDYCAGGAGTAAASNDN